MAKRPCLDCGRISEGSRCEPCRLAQGRQRERTRDRPNSGERGYDAQHQRTRKRVLKASDICWLCHHPGADQVDDVLPKSLGGTSTLVNLRPAHGTKPCPTCGLRCNQARGNRTSSLSATNGEGR